MSEEHINSLQLPNPEDRKKLQNMLREAALCKQRVADERKSITEMSNLAKKDYGIEKKVFNKLVNLMTQPDLSTVASEYDQVEYLFETVIKPSIFKNNNENV